jgi:hypothetical protein
MFLLKSVSDIISQAPWKYNLELFEGYRIGCDMTCEDQQLRY